MDSIQALRRHLNQHLSKMCDADTITVADLSVWVVEANLLLDDITLYYVEGTDASETYGYDPSFQKLGE